MISKCNTPTDVEENYTSKSKNRVLLENIFTRGSREIAIDSRTSVPPALFDRVQLTVELREEHDTEPTFSTMLLEDRRIETKSGS